MGIEPTQPAWKAGILTIELHPQTTFSILANKMQKVNISHIYFGLVLCYTAKRRAMLKLYFIHRRSDYAGYKTDYK